MDRSLNKAPRPLVINLHTPRLSQGRTDLVMLDVKPPEAQLSKRRSIPAPQLSQWSDSFVLMVTISKETWRKIQQGRADM